MNQYVLKKVREELTAALSEDGTSVEVTISKVRTEVSEARLIADYGESFALSKNASHSSSSLSL